MEFTKLTAEEIDTWKRLFSVSYEASTLSSSIDFESYHLLLGAFVAALDEDYLALCMQLSDGNPSFRHAKELPQLRELVIRLYEHAIAGGDAGACCDLGNMYHDTSSNGSDEDYARAIELYELGKTRGCGQAAINLGYIYYYGRGVERDYARAYECFAFGALIDENPEGYWKLGDLYASGKGVRQSSYSAWSLYRKAHDLSHDSPIAARAAHHMADYLLEGIEDVLDADPERALALYVEAELGYYKLIDNGLTYYQRQLEQAIEGQSSARDAIARKRLNVVIGF